MQIAQTSEQFENSVLEIRATRENTRLISRCLFHFFPLLTCHNNPSSHSIGTKRKHTRKAQKKNTNNIFILPAYRCYMWKILKIGFMASEEMLFENFDGRTMLDKDGRRQMEDGRMAIL